MFKEAVNQLKTAFMILALMTFLTGFIYPASITAAAQLLFPRRANGSLIEQNGKTIGSELIGQSFTTPNYFWSRPSATSPYPFNGENSSGSNMGPSNPNFLATVKERAAQFRQLNSEAQLLIPVDLVTASGSGLDPDISPAAAFYQIPRIAKARNIAEQDLQKLIEHLIQPRSFWILGEPRINVLQLNIALDKLRSNDDKTTPHS